MKLCHVRKLNSIKNIAKNRGLYLVDDEWEDFGYRTRFILYYLDTDGKESIIGSVKITYKGYRADSSMALLYYRKPAERLKYGEVTIGKDFCSLGESLEYYENLRHFFPLNGKEYNYNSILSLLRDAATHESIYYEFQKEASFIQSLLRESSSYLALEAAKGILDQKPVEFDNKKNGIFFKYRFYAPYTDSESKPTDIEFDFSEKEYPYRIHLLVGKNGTGKTQLLNALADSLSGVSSTSSSEKNGFVGDRPAVDRVISMAYSAFDDGFRNRESSREASTISYIYCGIHSNQGLLDMKKVNDNFIKALKRIKDKKREDKWKEIMQELMEGEFSEILPEVFKKGIDSVALSSGQRILISTMTEAVSNIEEGSILLIDELELHLHPNAISNTMRMLYKLLDLFNSYAIIGTHSPLIVQEIPKEYVHVLRRINNILYASKPKKECFGDDVSSITDDIFDVLSVESNYKTVLSDLSKRYKYKDVIKLFGDYLPLNARIYLGTCYPDEV